MEALDATQFEALPVYIDRGGVWSADTAPLLQHGDPTQPHRTERTALTLLPGNERQQLIAADSQQIENVDVIFPILHGPLGEDGAIQGLLELATIPYVGPGILGSAIGMDKDVAKRLLREDGIPVARHIALHQSRRAEIDSDTLIAELGLPLFVKPANMGSSIGVAKIQTKQELLRAIDDAFHYDRKVLLEAAIVGQEVECAVLGNEQPEVSLPGRIVTEAAFYDYREKYQDTGHTSMEIPAKLSEDMTSKVRQVAAQVYRTLECEGMARVDMFITPENEVIVNEINTIPGFTEFSMYPKLWESSGLNYTGLITKLLYLAIERFEQRQALATSYNV